MFLQKRGKQSWKTITVYFSRLSRGPIFSVNSRNRMSTPHFHCWTRQLESDVAHGSIVSLLNKTLVPPIGQRLNYIKKICQHHRKIVRNVHHTYRYYGPCIQYLIIVIGREIKRLALYSFKHRHVTHKHTHTHTHKYLTQYYELIIYCNY